MAKKIINKKSKTQIQNLFRKLNKHMLTLIGKDGTNPDQAVILIERLNAEINKHFETKDEYKVRLSFDAGTGQMTMYPNNEKTEELFDLWWKFEKEK